MTQPAPGRDNNPPPPAHRPPGRLARRSTPATPGLRICRSPFRSEEHTSELQSLMRISYAVFCLKKKKTNIYITTTQNEHHHDYTKILTQHQENIHDNMQQP